MKKYLVIKKALIDFYYSYLYKIFQFIGTIFFKLVRNVITYVVICIVSLMSVIIWYLNTNCEDDVINVHEIRFYILIGIIAIGLVIFATLRLYNAIYNNTTVMARLVKSNQKLTDIVDDQTKEIGRISQSDKAHANGILSRYSSKMDELISGMQSLKSTIKK